MQQLSYLTERKPASHGRNPFVAGQVPRDLAKKQQSSHATNIGIFKGESSWALKCWRTNLPFET